MVEVTIKSESFEFEELKEKPEENEIRGAFDERQKTKEQSEDHEQEEQEKEQKQSEEQVFSDEDYEGLGDVTVDVGNYVLSSKYLAPFDEFSPQEEQRIRKYSGKIERKYPWLKNWVDKFPEIALGATLIMAGATRRRKATARPEEKKEKK